MSTRPRLRPNRTTHDRRRPREERTSFLPSDGGVFFGDLTDLPNDVGWDLETYVARPAPDSYM